MSVREGIGKVRKSAPSVDDPTLQRAIDTIYKDINKVADGTNLPSGTSASKGSLGTSGDIKLYKGSGSDGSTGYFLQARFNDGWATTRLTLESKNPEATEVVGSPPGGGGGDEPFITRYGVTYTNLDFTNSIAPSVGDDGLDGLVARGNHGHAHWIENDPIELDGTEYDSGEIVIGDTTHINSIHFPLSPNNAGTTTTLVGNADFSGSHSGDEAVAARWDHYHKLNTQPNYTWTGNNTFGADYGAVAGRTTQFNGPDPDTGAGIAVDVIGAFQLDGDFLVAYGETQSANVEMETNLTVNTNNLNGLGIQEHYDYKTLVNGPTKFTAGLSVKRGIVDDGDDGDYEYHYDEDDQTAHPDNKPPVIIQENSDAGQLRLQYSEENYFDFKVDTGGNLLLETVGSIYLKPDIEGDDDSIGYVLPKAHLKTSLGDLDNQWASIHAGELVVQNIMAMNIMSTIGGQLRVCPTSKIAFETLEDDETGHLYLAHNDPNFRDAWVFLQKADLNATDEGVGDYSYIEGVVQFEAIRTAATVDEVNYGDSDNPAYKYSITTRAGDGTAANEWKIDDACVVLYNLDTGKTKGFIELTSTGSVFNRYGPRVSLNAAKDGDTAWDAAKKVVVIGNLRNLADYNATDDNNFGMILANNAHLSTIGEGDLQFKGLTLDQTDGVRMWNTPIQIYESATRKVEILKDGSMRLGASLLPETVETKEDWDVAGSNIGLSWDGDELIINGIINVAGTILEGELSDLLDGLAEDFGTLEDAVNDIENLDQLSNYQAAEAIATQYTGNIYNDWEMEYNPSSLADYTDMSQWGGSSNPVFEKVDTSIQTPHNGGFCMKGISRLADGSNHSIAYNTDIQEEHRWIPVVPGMKLSASYWYYIPESTWTDGPPNGQIALGFKFYDVSKTNYTWKSFANSENITDTWSFTQGTLTVPDEYTWYDSGGGGGSDGSTSKPGYYKPYLVVHHHEADENDVTSDLIVYIDDVSLTMDSSLAMPANPSGNPGFFAGSDAFGVHDGDEWRTYFGLNAGNSVMKLTGLAQAEEDWVYVDQVTWDGSVFDIGGKIQLTASSGDLKLEGDIKIGQTGSIYSNGGGFGQEGVFMGHTWDGSDVHSKFSLINVDADKGQFKWDSEDNILEITNSDINVGNGNITIDNAAVDVIMGQDIANQNNNDHDDVLIGTWDAQKASSPSGQGILVKHDTIRNEDAGDAVGSNKYDYSKLDQNGFNRAGFEYPIFIGAVSECPGWSGKTNSNTTWQGHKGNKIFDNYNGQKIYYPGSSELYNKVPPGRALFLQVTSAAMCNNSNASQGPWPVIFETGYRDGGGEDTKSQRATFGPIFYRASDDYQRLTLKYQSSPPNENSKLENLGTLFNTNEENGPWNSFIPENTEVADLRVCNFFLQPNVTKLQIDVMWVNVMIWEVSMSNVPAESVFYSSTDSLSDFPWGMTLNVGGGAPF